MHTYKAKLVKIVDAATIVLDIDLGFGVHINAQVRLRGLEAPEGPVAGKKAIEFLERIIYSSELLVTTGKLDGNARDKYGKWVVTIYAKMQESTVRKMLPPYYDHQDLSEREPFWSSGYVDVNRFMEYAGHAKVVTA